jgi:TM2 domain-containing membrane protein YozV
MPQKDDVYTITDDNTYSSLPSGMGRSRTRSGTDTVYSDRSSRSFRVASSRPPKAASLSLFFWGTGQMYNEQRALGWLLLLTQVLAVAGHWCMAMIWPSLREMVDFLGMNELNLMLTVAGLDLLIIAIMLSNVYHAYEVAGARDGEFDGLEIPFLSGVASLVVPGWGQILNAQPGKAITFLFSVCVGFATAALLMLTPFLSLLATIDPDGTLRHKVNLGGMGIVGAAATLWALSVYDAVLVARCQKRMG